MKRKLFFLLNLILHPRFFSKEANNGWELKIKTKGFPISCIITSEETKDILNDLLNEYIKESGAKQQKGRKIN